MITLDLKIVSTTKEVTVGGFVYRLTARDDGVMLFRVPTDAVLWSHGIICQVYDEANKFVSTAMHTKAKKFASEDEAVSTIVASSS